MSGRAIRNAFSRKLHRLVDEDRLLRRTSARDTARLDHATRAAQNNDYEYRDSWKTFRRPSGNSRETLPLTPAALAADYLLYLTGFI